VSEQVKRPAPKENTYIDTRPFWAAAREKKLVLQFCRDTGRFQHFPRPVSLYTGSRNLEWREVSGRGTIYACSVVRIPAPGLDGRLPLPVATVELEEGVRMLATILDAKPEDLRIGQRVTLAWDTLDGGQPYPAFRLED
jgi:uncharacterized OB-fold protein